MITITKLDTTTAIYSQYRVDGDRAEFIGPLASDISTDSILVKSTAPKRGNGQYGNRRSTLDLVRATTVPNLDGVDVVRNRKLSVVTSIPVGTSEADLFLDAYAMSELLRDEIFVKELFLQGKIEH